MPLVADRKKRNPFQANGKNIGVDSARLRSGSSLFPRVDVCVRIRPLDLPGAAAYLMHRLKLARGAPIRRRTGQARFNAPPSKAPAAPVVGDLPELDEFFVELIEK